MTVLTDLLTIECPQFIEGNRYARDYIAPDIARCDRCKGKGVYINLRGEPRVCETYRAWIKYREGNK